MCFEQREGVKVLTTYNGCGILVAQMRAGEKPHAYISCDATYMDIVKDLFHDSKEISRNRMVIITPKGNPYDIKTLEDLANPKLKIGFSHPEKSALGDLTHKMLTKLNLKDKIYDTADKIILSDSGHLTVNQVGVKSLDAGIVYRSNAMSAPNSKERLEIISIPLPSAIATQPYAIAKSSTHKYLMQRLMDRITNAKTRSTFEKYDHNLHSCDDFSMLVRICYFACHYICVRRTFHTALAFYFHTKLIEDLNNCYLLES